MRYIKKKKEIRLNLFFLLRAEDGTRTRDPNLGKVMLYQLSYFRVCGCKDKASFYSTQVFSKEIFNIFSSFFNQT